MNSLIFLYIVFGISIVFYICTVLITVALVIPRQTHEAKIRDRLAKLRRQMQANGALSLIVAFVSIIALTSRYFVGAGDLYRYIITTAIFVHALCLLAQAILHYRIYHQDYSVNKK